MPQAAMIDGDDDNDDESYLMRGQVKFGATLKKRGEEDLMHSSELGSLKIFWTKRAGLFPKNTEEEYHGVE
uniref:Uncharacterized protein n=1 Tax=Oryza barthii TaxID=65489 RepID=A0A0D3H3N7_9ORYZ